MPVNSHWTQTQPTNSSLRLSLRRREDLTFLLSSDSEDNRKVTVGVYLDRPAGTLSFYRVSPDGGGSSDTLTHIHTFLSTFTQDLYPGFRLMWSGCSVSLCEL
ncbi:unnamed protein product [Gadus morhua 'NCC']